MEYQDINEKIALISGFNNIGIIKNAENTILIDSGLEDRIAANTCKLLAEKDRIPSVIINTHSHADHCGGNNYIQKNYNINIISSLKESLFIENPCLEPLCFFSGSKPLQQLENKFLQALPSKVTQIVKPGDILEIDGISLTFLSLAGHSIDQIGVVVDGTVFCGDAFFSEYVLDKYKLPFLIDFDKTIETLEFLKDTNYDLYIPAHGKPTKNIEPIINLNIYKMKKIEEDIISLLKTEKTTEELLYDIFKKYSIKTSGAQQYYLLKTTVMAYLSSLVNRSIIKTGIKDNILSWKISKVL